MDLNDLDFSAGAEQGAVLHLTHPVTHAPLIEDGKPWTITLAGEDSQRYRKQMSANRKRFAAVRGRQNNEPTLEEVEDSTANILAACTIEWSGFKMHGEPFPCNFANAKKVYTTRGFNWIKAQVDAFVADRSNFLQTSSDNSATTSDTKPT